MKSSTLLRAALMLLPMLAPPVQAEEALWGKTMAQAQAAKQLVAGDIDTTVTATKGSDPASTFRFQSHLSGWSKDQPVYSTIEIDPVPGRSKAAGQASAGLIDTVLKLAEGMLEPGAKATRSEGQKLDGKTWAVFQMEDGAMGQKMVAKIWADAETGCLHQIDADLHVTLFVDGRIKTYYVADAKGRCLPSQIEANIDFIIPFKASTAKLKQASSNWIERPAASTLEKGGH